MKRAIMLPVLAVALLLIACSRAPITEPRARHVAEDAFTRTCRSFHLSPGDYRGPISTSVGGAVFAFEWLHREIVDHDQYQRRWVRMRSRFYKEAREPNQTIQPTADRCDASLQFMKTRPLQATLAFARGDFSHSR